MISFLIFIMMKAKEIASKKDLGESWLHLLFWDNQLDVCIFTFFLSLTSVACEKLFFFFQMKVKTKTISFNLSATPLSMPLILSLPKFLNPFAWLTEITYIDCISVPNCCFLSFSFIVLPLPSLILKHHSIFIEL